MSFEQKKQIIIKRLSDKINYSKESVLWDCENVTSFINKYRKEIKTCLNFKGFSFEANDFVTIDMHAPTLGTMLDILASWHITKKIEIDKYSIRPGFPFQEKLKNNNIFVKAYVAAVLTQQFRSGYPADVDSAINRTFSKQEIENFTLLHNRIKRYLNTKNNKVDNPNFYSYDYFLKGDSDFMYDDTLCDMKASKNNTIGVGWIRQLFIYWFLNEESKKYEKIKTLNIQHIEIYNPLYDYTYKAAVNDIVDNLDFLKSLQNEREDLILQAINKRIIPFSIKKEQIQNMNFSFKNWRLVNRIYKKYMK